MGIDAQMLIRNKGKELYEKEIKRLSYDLCSTFGPESFWLSKDSSWGKPHHALEAIEEYTQDGDSIFPEEGEQLIEVHVSTRYWGPDYERGDILLLINVAEFLENRLKDVEIWYGGDSSGVLAVPFDKKLRDEYKKLFFEVNHEPYRSGWSMGAGNKPRYCDFCEQYMTQYGTGPTYQAWICYGCGFKEKTDDNGKTWVEDKERN